MILIIAFKALKIYFNGLEGQHIVIGTHTEG